MEGSLQAKASGSRTWLAIQPAGCGTYTYSTSQTRKDGIAYRTRVLWRRNPHSREHVASTGLLKGQPSKEGQSLLPITTGRVGIDELQERQGTRNAIHRFSSPGLICEQATGNIPRSGSQKETPLTRANHRYWRAVCSESCMHGSEGGTRKRPGHRTSPGAYPTCSVSR
jgi:hypothetical protein